MPLSLPSNPSLEQLKNQAKDLLRAYRAQDPDAMLRIREQISSSEPPIPTVTLAIVQHLLAREYGFLSWPKLKQHVEGLRAHEERAAYLQRQTERLGARDWREILAADALLVQAGQAGIDAAIEGLSHPRPSVRRGCVGFLDHQATDACVPALRDRALHDPVPAVRRGAVHSLGCQRCKPSPLTEDLVDLLAQVALTDSNAKVRAEAVWILGTQPSDPRAVSALESVLRDETDNDLKKAAHFSLKRQDPGYRKTYDDRAREAGIARARLSLGSETGRPDGDR